MPEMWRLFIAIELPEEVLSALVKIQARLKQQPSSQAVRWVDPKGIHLTLKFLGDVPVDQRDTLQDALTRAVHGLLPFDLATGGLGCFPNPKRPRVVWVGIQGQMDILHTLRDAVEAQIAPLGYPTEDRPFSPHLTLGRVRREADRRDVSRLGELVAGTALEQAVAWHINQVCLIRSELKPSGAVYTSLFQAALGC
jgi:2'-5' RNA ligase